MIWAALRGHVACDGESRSEIVMPIEVGGNGQLLRFERVIDVLTHCVLSRLLESSMSIALLCNGFDGVDLGELDKLAKMLGDGCDWEGMV